MPVSSLGPGWTADESHLLRALIDTAGSVILGLRPDHRIFVWNQAAEQLYQTPRAEAFGRDYVATFIAPEFREFVAADIREVLEGKVTKNFEDDSILPDGSRRTLIWNVTRVLDPSGAPAGIIAVGQDITERKVAEERFRLVFEQVADGLLLADDSGVIDCNPAALRLLGLDDKAVLVGRRPSEFSPPLQPDGQPSDLKSRSLGEATREQGALTFEWTHRRPDGEDVPVEVNVRHAFLAGRRHSVVTWHDLTHRRELEQDRVAMQQRLAEAQRMEAVGQLAGGIAHDFNNLLASVRNALELVEAHLPPAAAARADLELARDATRRAAGLTRQLLAFSRRQKLRTEAVDLVELVREALPFIERSLTSLVQVTLVAPAGPLVVEADRTQLEQVLLNLVLNARDAMPAGGRLEVRVEPTAGGDQVQLVVQDTGTGMDEATRLRAFEPFFTTKPLGEGSGLGLAVVYGIVTEAGGVVALESAPGAGSTVTVQLPRSSAAEAPPVAAVRRFDGEGRQLLLVDDEPSVRHTTRRLLERANWRVVDAEDGEAGWARFAADPGAFAVVLSDVRMPGLDGIRLAGRIHALAPGTPVILFSGFDLVEDGTASTLPYVHFLAKPFEIAQLHATLRAALAGPATNAAPPA